MTALLRAWSAGDAGALAKLIPLVYDELRKAARVQVRREPPGHPLQATELVHQLYLKLIDQTRADWRDRGQFFSVVAKLMRRILVDLHRADRALKRPPARLRVALGDEIEAPVPDLVSALALASALTKLEAMDALQTRIVELRWLVGLTEQETAEVLGVSQATVKREWHAARLWLRRELDSERK